MSDQGKLQFITASELHDPDNWVRRLFFQPVQTEPFERLILGHWPEIKIPEDAIPNGSDIALTRTITVCPHPNVHELYQGSEGTIMAYMGLNGDGEQRYGVRFGKWETVVNRSWFGVINLATVSACSEEVPVP